MIDKVEKFYSQLKGSWPRRAQRIFKLPIQDIEDIFQETFIEAAHGDLPRKEKVLRYWLQQKFFNKCKDFLRKAIRERTALRNIPEEALFGQDTMLSTEDLMLLVRLSRYGIELEMRYIEGLGVEEIAQKRKISYETAKKRLQRGKEEVKSQLGTLRSIIEMLE